MCLWELFWWAFQGAKVCLAVHGGEKDSEYLQQVIQRHQVTTMHFVPSMLNVFLEYINETGSKEKLASLKRVFASGEALLAEQAERFYQMFKPVCSARLVNLYGPTEATVDVSYFDCLPEDKLDSVPIGKPIDNIQLYIVDRSCQLQPIGVVGELCIAGIGLVRGYVNRQELTEEKFVLNPFAPGERMYRTGDLARWLPDGNIAYLGRIDHQVKIRGYRIELGEIESRLLEHEGVKEAVVVAREDAQGGAYLCAYTVGEGELPATELKEHLSASLPVHGAVPLY